MLEKCSSSEERMRNFVRFVQLKKPLREFLRVSVREGESEARHWKNAEFEEDLQRERTNSST